MFEILAAPALIAVPFLLEFGSAAGAVSIMLGAMLMGLALSTHGERRTISLSAQAGFDYLIGVLAIVTGVALGIGSAPAVATAFSSGSVPHIWR